MRKHFRTTSTRVRGSSFGLFFNFEGADGFELIKKPYTEYKTHFGCLSIYLLFGKKARILEIYI